MSKDRIEYIDTLKGLLIILVVVGHTGVNPNIQRWIYSFHMPLFFIISGFFYKVDNNIISYKRVKRVLFPFLIYTVMAIIFPGLPWLIFKSKELPWNEIFYLREKIFFNTPIWFLIVLFFIEIKMNIINKIFEISKYQKIIFLLLVLVQIMTIRYCPILPFGIRIGLSSLSIFYIGILWKNNLHYCSIEKNISNLICVCLLFFSIYLGYNSERIDLFSMKFSNDLIRFYIIVAVNIVLWIFLSKKLSSVKILKLFGKNTIYILGLHYYIRFFLQTIYKILNIGEALQRKIATTFIEAIITCILLYIIICLKDDYFERISHKLREKYGSKEKCI